MFLLPLPTRFGPRTRSPLFLVITSSVALHGWRCTARGIGEAVRNNTLEVAEMLR